MLQEFCQEVDDLLATGYDPKLDDGVGKNIAPLQKRKMLSYEVLNAGQLKKYLKALKNLLMYILLMNIKTFMKL